MLRERTIYESHFAFQMLQTASMNSNHSVMAHIHERMMIQTDTDFAPTTNKTHITTKGWKGWGNFRFRITVKTYSYTFKNPRTGKHVVYIHTKRCVSLFSFHTTKARCQLSEASNVRMAARENVSSFLRAFPANSRLEQPR